MMPNSRRGGATSFIDGHESSISYSAAAVRRGRRLISIRHGAASMLQHRLRRASHVMFDID